MFAHINNALARKWLRKHGIKLTCGIASIPDSSSLLLEEGASIHCEKMRFDGELSIGAMTYIRSESELWNVHQIGRFCSISNNVVIGQSRGGPGHALSSVSTHPFQFRQNGNPSGYQDLPGTNIGHDVWIGRDSMIMEGVSVGIGAVIATRSLVTRDVPDYAIVAGTPARIVRFRHSPDLIQQLLESQWWNMDFDLLMAMPLENVEQFLESLPKTGKQANYKKCCLTNTGWKLVN